LFFRTRSLLARGYERIIASRTRIFATAGLAILVAGACKYALVGVLLQEGASRAELRMQDALTAGVLAGIAVGIALAVAHFRRKQIAAQVKVVSDLNHHLRNALNIILNSHYLPAESQKDAILESVERIDRALRTIIPQDAPAVDVSAIEEMRKRLRGRSVGRQKTGGDASRLGD
jgi:hypothetical protein